MAAPLVAGLLAAGRLLLRAAPAVIRMAKSPAVRRAAVKAASKARSAFSKTKVGAKELCKSVQTKAGEIWRRLTGKMNVQDLLRDASRGTAGKSKQFSKPGGLNQANKDFDRLTKGVPVKNQGGGIRSATLRDGSTVSVRPTSTGGKPTIQINPPTGRAMKVRYD